MKNQRGSATIFALVAFIFTSIMLGALLSYITNEYHFTTKTRDVIEAQCAAESGIKMALSQFKKVPKCEWGWLNRDQNFANDNNKKYKVSITGPDTSGAPPMESPDPGVYTVTSVGEVGKSTKTVTANITINGVLSYALYSMKNVTMSGKVNLNGKIGANGTVTNSGDIIHGDHSAIDQNQKEHWPFSDFNTFTSKQKSGRPINSNVKTSTDLKDQDYSNQTIIIDGDLTVDGNKNFSNVSIFVSGAITCSGILHFSNNCLIVSGKGMTLSGDNLGGAVYISYGDITVSGNSTMNGGSMYAKGDIIMNGNSTLKYSQEAIDKNDLGNTISGWHVK
jgi:cytoskeletal protein CcmA (bactofilin family)